MNAVVNPMKRASFAGQCYYALLALFTLFYLLPYAVAGYRGHPSKGTIAVLNLFAGWTFIGWIAALVWACTTPRPIVVVIQQQA
jgi:hypothetical protein